MNSFGMCFDNICTSGANSIHIQTRMRKFQYFHSKKLMFIFRMKLRWSFSSLLLSGDREKSESNVYSQRRRKKKKTLNK